MRRLKVAVTGAGIKGSPDGREGWAVRAHVPALKALPDLYELAAVCTTRMETAEASARHFGVPHAFDGVERMLAELPGIDIVCVSARPVHHFRIAEAALRAGKHVYCEQPLGVSTREAEILTGLAREKNLRTVIGHQSHYEPATLQMAELVREGFIGKPIAFNHTYFVSNYIAPRPSHRQWLFQSDMGGHPAYRSGHSLDRVHSVLGKDVAEICADMAVKVPERAALDRAGTIKSDQVDNMNFMVRLGDGVMGTVQVSFTAWFGTGNHFEVYGSEGMLMLATADSPAWSKEKGEGDPSRGELRLYGARADVKSLIANPTAPERLQKQFKEIPIADRHVYVHDIERGRATFLVAQTWHAFARAINEGRECAPSFRDKLKIHRVWDAAEESLRTRAWKAVDYSGV